MHAPDMPDVYSSSIPDDRPDGFDPSDPVMLAVLSEMVSMKTRRARLKRVVPMCDRWRKAKHEMIRMIDDEPEKVAELLLPLL